MEKCAVVTGSRGVSDGYHAVAFGENLRLDLLKDITFWKDDVFAIFPENPRWKACCPSAAST